MGALILDICGVAAFAVTLRARADVALGAVIAVVVLIPSSLVVPHVHTSLLTVDRLLVIGLTLRVLRAVRHDEIPRSALAPTPVVAALAVLLVVWLLLGATAGQTQTPGQLSIRLAQLASELALSVSAAALLRVEVRPDRMLLVVAGTATVAAVVGLIEHATGDALGRELFRATGQGLRALAGNRLESRGGHVRLRSSAEFALSFGWIAAICLPSIVVCALRNARQLVVGAVATGVVLLAIYWTYSRSAAAVVPVLIVALAVYSRDRRLVLLAGVTVAICAVAVLISPALQAHLSTTADQGSISIRFERLPVILRSAATHPFRGLGFGGTASTGAPTTDNTYLLSYVETGAIGAAVFAAAVGCLLLQVARGIRLRADPARLVAAATGVGVLAALIAGGFEDSLVLDQVMLLVAILAAIGTTAAEPELGRLTGPAWSARHGLGLAVVGAAAGLTAFAVAPSRWSQERTFLTLPVTREIGPYDTVVQDHSLIGTVCSLAGIAETQRPGTRFSCRDNFTAAGAGTLRISATTSSGVLDAYQSLDRQVTAATYLTSYRTLPSGPPVHSRATIWKTAPVSGLVLGLVIGLLLPFRRRRDRGEPATGPDQRVVTTAPAAPAAAPRPLPVRVAG